MVPLPKGGGAFYSSSTMRISLPINALIDDPRRPFRIKIGVAYRIVEVELVA
jgi:hypothetical protein